MLVAADHRVAFNACSSAAPEGWHAADLAEFQNSGCHGGEIPESGNRPMLTKWSLR